MPADERWTISPYARVSWRGGRMELVSGSGAALATTDPRLVRLLHAFADPRTAEEAAAVAGGGFAPEQVTATVAALVRAGALLPAGQEDRAAGRFWEPTALAFHQATRAPGARKAAATSVPPVADRSSAATVELDAWSPASPASPVPAPDLPDLLASRLSRREWPARRMPRQALSDLLWLVARNRKAPRDPRNPASTVRRPYPSGGAAYSLEVYPVVAPGAVEAVPAGVHRYLPDRHALEVLSEQEADWRPVLEAAAAAAACSPPPVVLVVTSRFARAGEWYGRIAYSLVLKEVGALFQTAYLACGHLGLAACALGGGTPAGLVARLSGTDELAEPVVGEMMVGPV